MFLLFLCKYLHIFITFMFFVSSACLFKCFFANIFITLFKNKDFSFIKKDIIPYILTAPFFFCKKLPFFKLLLFLSLLMY